LPLLSEERLQPLSKESNQSQAPVQLERYAVGPHSLTRIKRAKSPKSSTGFRSEFDNLK
jgi:hypothetical protein